MKTIRLLIVLPLLSAGGCALGIGHRAPEDSAIVETQVPAEQLAACIGRAAGTTPTQDAAGGYKVDLSATSPTRTVLISQKDAYSAVTKVGDQNLLPPQMGRMAVDCALQLAPRSAAVSG